MDDHDFYYDRKPLIKCLFTCFVLIITQIEILRIYFVLCQLAISDILIQIKIFDDIRSKKYCNCIEIKDLFLMKIRNDMARNSKPSDKSLFQKESRSVDS